MRLLNLISSVLVLAATSLMLSGCAGLQSTTASATAKAITLAEIHGSVFGGQQPIVGATVQIYQAGATGYGQGASGLISGGGVLSGSGGNFSITGLYTCTSGSQVYLVATGGNPGVGTNNNAALIAGLGLCNNLTSSSFVQVNEVTTVATVWALAPFMNDVNIGAPPSNQSGLASAFADVNTLVSTATGLSPGANLPIGTTVPSAEVYALADVLASCINSTGSGGGGACDRLFAYTTVGGVMPIDTLAAVINIARYPASNVNSILALVGATPPFATDFASANDLSLAVTFTGSGLNGPAAVAIDAAGNVWLANSGNNSVTELSHAGAALSGGNGYTAGSMAAPSAIAIDTTGNAWIANSGNSTLTELIPSGANAANSPFSGGGLSTPTAIAIDGLGNVWLANSGNNSASEFSPSGGALSAAISGFTAAGVSAPVGIAINPH
jgi:hypothetical protein